MTRGSLLWLFLAAGIVTAAAGLSRAANARHGIAEIPCALLAADHLTVREPPRLTGPAAGGLSHRRLLWQPMTAREHIIQAAAQPVTDVLSAGQGGAQECWPD